jgi:uncharacterized pyridoxal phosphate-containing UPF0001 family protein
MRHATQQTDATTIVHSLDAEQIAERLNELAAEQQALRVLLRSARAREQVRRRRERREGGTDGK